jgi:hypothetical protein
MNAAEQKAHDKACERLIQVWTKLHGFPPRTFKLEEWTTEEVVKFIEDEIAEHEAPPPPPRKVEKFENKT